VFFFCGLLSLLYSGGSGVVPRVSDYILLLVILSSILR
jgi:hypothetical protein